MGPPAVDAGIALTVYPSFKWMPDGYATPDLLPRTVEEVRLAVLPYLFTAGEGGGSHPLFSALGVHRCSVRPCVGWNSCE